MIGQVLTLGFGGRLGLVPTIGYSIAAGAAVAAVTHHGADDGIDHDPRKRRRARIRMEDEAVLRIVVSCVTEGLL